MIYSTNRTASLGNDEFTVDVNESYFGAGALSFMQENAQDELALFEAAIKSDIDEALIGESAGEEITALNEGFVQNAGAKIKAMMVKFIEWLKSVMRSAVAKMTNLLNRDNAQFIKSAKKRISTMPNAKNFKYNGKALKLSEAKETTNATDGIKAFYDKAASASSKEALDNIVKELDSKVDAFKEMNLRKAFQDTCVIDAKDESLTFVEAHLKFLEDKSKKQLAEIKKDMTSMEADAKKLAKEAEKKAKDYKGEDEIERNKLAVMAQAAAAYRNCCQSYVKDSLYILSQQIKIARAVVTRAMGASPKNEGFEYTEELIDAMIESADFEYDEALEEMSEGKDCDDCETGAEPDEDEE